MKKVLMIAIVGGAFALTSCKKDYVCSCTASGVTLDVTYQDVKKKDAQEACDLSNTTYSLVGGSCELK